MKYQDSNVSGLLGKVTPLAGVWIEIDLKIVDTETFTSLPLRECGLKYEIRYSGLHGNRVTPLAGVWIEIT